MRSALKRGDPASARSSLHLRARACKGQHDVEHRAAAELALRPDLAAVELDDLADDGKAEPGALDIFRRLRVDAREAFEDRLERVGWDPKALVAHIETQLVAVGPRGDGDPPTGGRVLHRVVQEIGCDLGHPI